MYIHVMPFLKLLYRICCLVFTEHFLVLIVCKHVPLRKHEIVQTIYSLVGLLLIKLLQM